MSEEEYKKIFAQNLKSLMELHGKNQMDLVHDLNLSQSTVSNWCTGLKLPRMNKVQLLADYFDVKRSDLLEDKSSSIPFSTKKEPDFAKRLESALKDLESSQEALMFSGKPLDQETKELLKASLENSLLIGKLAAKRISSEDK